MVYLGDYTHPAHVEKKTPKTYIGCAMSGGWSEMGTYSEYISCHYVYVNHSSLILSIFLHFNFIVH